MIKRIHKNSISFVMLFLNFILLLNPIYIVNYFYLISNYSILIFFTTFFSFILSNSP